MIHWTKKQLKGFEQAGKDYAADWLCWNQVKLSNLNTVKEKDDFIRYNAQFESCAGDMGMYHPDSCNPLSEGDASSAADYIYEGMCKTVKKYLANPEKWFS